MGDLATAEGYIRGPRAGRVWYQIGSGPDRPGVPLPLPAMAAPAIAARLTWSRSPGLAASRAGDLLRSARLWAGRTGPADRLRWWDRPNRFVEELARGPGPRSGLERLHLFRQTSWGGLARPCSTHPSIAGPRLEKPDPQQLRPPSGLAVDSRTVRSFAPNSRPSRFRDVLDQPRGGRLFSFSLPRIPMGDHPSSIPAACVQARSPGQRAVERTFAGMGAERLPDHVGGPSEMFGPVTGRLRKLGRWTDRGSVRPASPGPGHRRPGTTKAARPGHIWACWRRAFATAEAGDLRGQLRTWPSSKGTASHNPPGGRRLPRSPPRPEPVHFLTALIFPFFLPPFPFPLFTARGGPDQIPFVCQRYRGTTRDPAPIWLGARLGEELHARGGHPRRQGARRSRRHGGKKTHPGRPFGLPTRAGLIVPVGLR